MRYVDYLGISLKQIHLFMNVAETLNITRSAEELHISSSMLSKNISGLEDSLGLILFLRERGRLRLTPAGKTLYENMTPIIHNIEYAIEAAYQKQKNETQHLRIGVPDSVDPTCYYFRTIEYFRKDHPSITYSFESIQVQNLIKGLSENRFDVIFTILFDEQSLMANTSIAYSVLRKYRLHVFAKADNPLAKKDSVTFNDIVPQKLVIYRPEDVPNYYNNVILPIGNKLNYEPRIAHYATSSDGMLLNTQNGDEIFISDPTRKLYSYTPFVSVPLLDSESGAIIAVNSENCSTLAEEFFRFTVKYWRTHTNEEWKIT